MVLMLVLPAACTKPPAAGDFDVGATRQEILESFGEPERKDEYRKTSAEILGPIEDFWSRVPLYSSVEVWVYGVDGGTIELYFIDDSERVLGTGFVPRGAVFEARK